MKRFTSIRGAGYVALIIAGFGTALLLFAVAASYTMQFEAESGVRQGPVSVKSDASASGGASIVLNPSLAPANAKPHDLLQLTNWKLTLPVDTSHPGNPDEITQPELATYENNSFFAMNSARDGVIFRAYVDGATTGGSSYPRSELREMTNNGASLASWSNTSGTHTMTITEAFTHLPEVKPHAVGAQIHDASDDVIMVRLEGNRLFVEANGDNIGDLETNYVLGTKYTIKIAAASGLITVYYIDVQKVQYQKSGDGWYFKAGCYAQSNTTKGDSPGAYAETIVYALSVSHN